MGPWPLVDCGTLASQPRSFSWCLSFQRNWWNSTEHWEKNTELCFTIRIDYLLEVLVRELGVERKMCLGPALNRMFEVSRELILIDCMCIPLLACLVCPPPPPSSHCRNLMVPRPVFSENCSKLHWWGTMSCWSSIVFANFLCLQKSLCSRFLLFCLKTTPDLLHPWSAPILFCAVSVLHISFQGFEYCYSCKPPGLCRWYWWVSLLFLFFFRTAMLLWSKKTIAEFALVWIPQFKLRR